jgi:hypothetical protein
MSQRATVLIPTVCAVGGTLIGVIVALDNQPTLPDCNVHPCNAETGTSAFMPIFLPIAIGAIGGLVIGALIVALAPHLNGVKSFFATLLASVRQRKT